MGHGLSRLWFQLKRGSEAFVNGLLGPLLPLGPKEGGVLALALEETERLSLPVGAWAHLDGNPHPEPMASAVLHLRPSYAEDALEMALSLIESGALDGLVMSAWYRLPLRAEERSALEKDVSLGRQAFFARGLAKLAKASEGAGVWVWVSYEPKQEERLFKDALLLYARRELTVSDHDLIALKANTNMAALVGAEGGER